MAPLPFGEYRPDVTSWNGATTALAQNVVPRADGYGPWRQFASFSRPLAEGNDTFTKILLHGDGTDASTTITDSNAGGSAHTWTAAGNAQIDTAQSIFGGASILFDGTGDWVTTSDHADFTLGSSNFTIDFWVRPATSGALLYCCGQGNNALSAATTSFYISRTAANRIEAGVSNGSAFTTLTGGTTSLVLGSWYFVRLVRSSNTLYLFAGAFGSTVVLEASASFSGSVNNSANDFRVGAGGEVTTTPMNGWIDEFRFQVGIAQSTAAFLAPTKAWDAPANGACRGMFYARNTDGSVSVFAGTSDATNGARLWRMNNTALDWVNVSKVAGYSALPTSYHWQFEQKGTSLVAVQPNAPPQVFNLASPALFSDLGGSPPQAAYTKMVGNILVLSGLTSNPFRVQWSDEDDITNWTTGVASSADFPEGGIVRGVAGGETGYIFQDTVIRRMVSRFGDTVTAFQFDKIAEDFGLLAPYSIVRAGERVGFLSQKGFYEIVGNGYPVPIGKEKFDRSFLTDYDPTALQLIIGAADPEGSRFVWGYKSGAGASGLFDKILIYDYLLQKPSVVIEQAGEYIATLASPGLTLENLDALFPNLDLMTISLDDIALANLPKLAMFDSTHSLGLFSGSNLEATIDTPEREISGYRMRIRGARMLTDAPTIYLSIGMRENLAASVSFSAEQLVDSENWCGAGISTRIAKGRTRIPHGTTWSFNNGVDPDFRQEGRRR